MNHDPRESELTDSDSIENPEPIATQSFEQDAMVSEQIPTPDPSQADALADQIIAIRNDPTLTEQEKLRAIQALQEPS